VNEFIDACRKEWRRLGVPDQVADEMAADLELDLGEAEADGFSTLEVIGPAALDPRSFADDWAAAQGVIPSAGAPDAPREKHLREPRRFGRLVPLTVSGLAVLIGASIATQRPTWRHFLGLPHLRFMGNAGAFSAGPPVDVQLIKLGTLVLLAGAIGLIATSAYWLLARGRRQTPA